MFQLEQEYRLTGFGFYCGGHLWLKGIVPDSVEQPASLAVLQLHVPRLSPRDRFLSPSMGTGEKAISIRNQGQAEGYIEDYLAC